MPQVTKEQVSLRQKDRKPALSLLFPSRLWAGCFSQQSCSRDGGSSLELLHQRSFQPSHAAPGQ